MAAKKPAPLARRLHSKPDTRWYVPGTPRGVGLEGLALLSRLPLRISAALLFVKDQATLEAQFAKVKPRLEPDALLWISYPKGGASDLTRDRGWACVEAAGLRPVTQIAVDETWSALRFRPGPRRSRS